MELRYGFISDERCKEIDSGEIRDPYGYGKVYTAERDDFVANEALIIKTEEHSVRIPNFKRTYEFTFYYDGEEI